jgi:hypothetical protein
MATATEVKTVENSSYSGSLVSSWGSLSIIPLAPLSTGAGYHNEPTYDHFRPLWTTSYA